MWRLLIPNSGISRGDWPSASLYQTRICWVRPETNASRRPSGDHTGLVPAVASIGSPPADGTLTIRAAVSVPRAAATHRPSGDTAGKPSRNVPRVIGDAAAPVPSSARRQRFACCTPRRYTSRSPSAETLQPLTMEKPVSKSDRPPNRTWGGSSGRPDAGSRSRSATCSRCRMT